MVVVKAKLCAVLCKLRSVPDSVVGFDIQNRSSGGGSFMSEKGQLSYVVMSILIKSLHKKHIINSSLVFNCCVLISVITFTLASIFKGEAVLMYGSSATNSGTQNVSKWHCVRCNPTVKTLLPYPVANWLHGLRVHLFWFNFKVPFTSQSHMEFLIQQPGA